MTGRSEVEIKNLCIHLLFQLVIARVVLHIISRVYFFPIDSMILTNKSKRPATTTLHFFFRLCIPRQLTTQQH